MQCQSAHFAPFRDGVLLLSDCSMNRRPKMWVGQAEIEALCF